MNSRLKVGTGQDCTIRELAETVAWVTWFTGLLSFAASEPDGSKRPANSP